jgi:hypothetical protein
LCAVATAAVFTTEEKQADQRVRNREIFQQLFSTSVLFGETLIVRARRCASSL